MTSATTICILWSYHSHSHYTRDSSIVSKVAEALFREHADLRCAKSLSTSASRTRPSLFARLCPSVLQENSLDVSNTKSIAIREIIIEGARLLPYCGRAGANNPVKNSTASARCGSRSHALRRAEGTVVSWCKPKPKSLLWRHRVSQEAGK